jgi:hypothetical protein
MKLVEYKKNQLVFYEGGIGDTFYIILSGSVSTYVKFPYPELLDTIQLKNKLEIAKIDTKILIPLNYIDMD